MVEGEEEEKKKVVVTEGRNGCGGCGSGKGRVD